MSIALNRSHRLGTAKALVSALLVSCASLVGGASAASGTPRALDTASSENHPTTPGTPAQVRALVAASTKISRLSSSQSKDLSAANTDNAGRVYRLGSC